MYSISFPDMFSSSNTKLVKDHDATWSNLYLLLNSMKKSLFGDPYFGSSIKTLMFEQNNQVLKDIIIDDIYSTILTFMQQITLKRKDIEIVANREAIYVKIKCTNLLDFQTNLYTLNLMSQGEVE